MNSVGIVLAHPMPHVQVALSNYELRDGVQYLCWTPSGVTRGYGFLESVGEIRDFGVDYKGRIAALAPLLEGRQRTIVVFGEIPPSHIAPGDFEVPENVKIVPVLCSDCPTAGFWAEMGHAVGCPPVRNYQFEDSGSVLDVILGFGNRSVRARASVQHALEQWYGLRITATGCQSAYQLHCVDCGPPAAIGEYLAPFTPLRVYKRLRRGDPLPDRDSLVAYNPITGSFFTGADGRSMLGIRRMDGDTYVGTPHAHGFAPVSDSYVVGAGDWVMYERRTKPDVRLAISNKVREASDTGGKQKITHF